MLYHVARSLVLTLAVLSIVFVSIVVSLNVTEDIAPVSSAEFRWSMLVTLPPMALLCYWAWYVNWGRHVAHLAGVCATLAAGAGLLAIAWARWPWLGPWELLFVPIAAAALGTLLRQPRIAALRLEQARRDGNVTRVAAGLQSIWPFVRRQAARLLGEMRCAAALPALQTAAANARSEALRRAASAAIARIESGGPDEKPAEADPWTAEGRWPAAR